jgi:hypothetical protein
MPADPAMQGTAMQQWYYIADHNKTGPVSEAILRGKLDAGELDQRTWVWTDGLPGWTLVSHVDGLSDGTPIAWPAVDPADRLPEPTLEMREPWFLHIGIANLFLMELLSGGGFQLYWCYRNWRYLRDRDREPMTPFWRACLNVFWMHALFRRIRRDQQLGRTWPPAFPATLLATIWVALNIGGAVGSLWYREHGPIIANLTVHGACLCLVPVQAAINRANRRRSPQPRMSRLNLRSVVCLGLVLMLATTALP